MITKITMNEVASYKNPTSLETDKKVNLIYGLNGTGKSILSNFLYERTSQDFANCSIEGLTNEEILVYNQRFIEENFYESENLKGIFTLSKENKEAEENVRNAEREIALLDSEKQQYVDAVAAQKGELSQRKQNAENKTWEIKTDYAGGDRVLEYCLESLKGKKDSLFGYVSGLAKPVQQPNVTTEQLKKEVEAIKGATAQKYDPLPAIDFSGVQIESDPLFRKEIIGNETSTVAELIKRLGNSDWVKEGLEYIPPKIEDGGEPCPFCQERTITNTLVGNIRNYFDESYANDVGEIEKLLSIYESGIYSVPEKDVYESNPYLIERRAEFENLFGAVSLALNGSKTRILQKLETPSQPVVLTDSAGPIIGFNGFIEEINKSITMHNKKTENKEASLADFKKIFWNIMRWNYDQTISTYQDDKGIIERKIHDLENKIADLQAKIAKQTAIVVEQQKRTINIDEAIANINNQLLELGIDSFSIEKHSDVLYQIARDQPSGHTFQTLSEGEKMVISFLYFIELCKGKKNAAEANRKKIIIIDDPISSLSHIYVFNVGELIKSNFTNSQSKYEQVFVLTHSLYFFYELTNHNEKKGEEYQKLFRITKNQNGSEFLTMKYREIQNDYQTYWQVIKDEKQPAALIANCMRNIIEYFFGFIENTKFNDLFAREAFRANRYKAFSRYMNRESH